MLKNFKIDLFTKFIFLLCLFVLIPFFIFSKANLYFQNDSEGLVVGKMICIKNNLNYDTSKFGLGRLQFSDNEEDEELPNVYQLYKNNEIDKNSYKFTNYISQIGIQGHIFSFLQRFIPKSTIGLLRFGCCVLFCLIIFAITFLINKKYNTLMALSFFIMTFANPWTINFSFNLYWVEFTWFLPMLISLALINFRKYKMCLYPLFYISILVKCMCGYEYLSTIMFSSILFLIIEAIIDTKNRKEIIKEIFIIGILEVLAFITTILIHATIYADGNLVENLQTMKIQLIERRTYGNANNYADALRPSLTASTLEVIWRYFWIGHYNGVKIELLTTIITFAVIIYNKLVKKEFYIKSTLLVLLSMFQALSWFVLAKSHSYVHIHVNYVLWYMGYMQFCFYYILRFFIIGFGVPINDKYIKE